MTFFEQSDDLLQIAAMSVMQAILRYQTASISHDKIVTAPPYLGANNDGAQSVIRAESHLYESLVMPTRVTCEEASKECLKD